MSPPLDERYDSAENDEGLPRWYNRNPPRKNFFEPKDKDETRRQNPPRYPEYRGQDIDKRYK